MNGSGNLTNFKLSLSNNATIFDYILIVTMASFLFFTNILLLISLRNKHGNFHILLKFLTVFDLLPSYNLVQDAVWKYTMQVTKVGCLINKYLFEISYLMSGFTLALMSYDRYRAICQPMREKINNYKLYIMIGVFVALVTLLEIYPLSFVTVFPESLDEGTKCGYSVGFDWHPMQIIIRVVMLLTVIIGQMLSIMKIKQSLMRRGLIQTEEIHVRNMKVLKSVRMMQWVFLALVVPFTLVYIFVGFIANWELVAIKVLSTTKGSIFQIALSSTFMLSMANHVVNPFIYGKLHQNICCRRSRQIQPHRTTQQASTVVTGAERSTRNISNKKSSILTTASSTRNTRKISTQRSSSVNTVSSTKKIHPRALNRKNNEMAIYHLKATTNC